MSDARRRQYFMVSVEVMQDPLGVCLQKEFGPAGIAAWVALLAAAKRSLVEGQITFASEADGWMQLGFPEPPGISLTEFLRTTGRMKQTRRRRRGGLTDVVLIRWGELQKSRPTRITHTRDDATTRIIHTSDTVITPLGHAGDTRRTPRGDERNPTSAPQIVTEISADCDGDAPPEIEIEIESENKREKQIQTRARDPLFDALVEVWGVSPADLTKPQQRQTGVAAAELRKMAVTPAEILVRGRLYRALPWNREGQRPSPSALVSHWAECVPAALERVDRKALDRELQQRSMDAQLRAVMEAR